MKKQILAAMFILVSGSVYAVTGTYTGQQTGSGPEASFKIGFASDKAAEIELDVGKVNGLNVTFPGSVSFDPSKASHSVQLQSRQIPLREIFINVSSVDPQKKVYSIPVNVTAYQSVVSSSGEASQRVSHERSYVFEYRTRLSPEYGLDGGLIDSEGSPTNPENTSETSDQQQNTITNQSQEQSNDPKKRGTEADSDGVNPFLVIAVLAVFGYVFYEVAT